MRSAAPKTYISKRMLASYRQRRQDLLDQRSENTNSVKAPVVPPKTFTEDEESKTVSNISAQAAQGSTLAPIEEEKKEFEQTGQVAAPETNAAD